MYNKPFLHFFCLVFKENVSFRNKQNVKSAMIFTPSSLQINMTIYVIDRFFFFFFESVIGELPNK